MTQFVKQRTNNVRNDHGVQFVSREFEDFLSDRGIKHHFSSIYYPPANGVIERFNSVVKNVIQNAINYRKSWKEATVQFLGVYRATVHATTGVSPSVLLHGRPMRTRLNIVGSILPTVKVDNLRNHVQKKQNKYKLYKDNNRKFKPVTLNVGDWVKVKKPGFVPKGYSHYSAPIQIARKLSDHTFETTDNRKWNISKLVKCTKPQDAYVDDHIANDFDVEQAVDNQGQNDIPGPAHVQQNAGANVAQAPLRRGNRVRHRPRWLQDYVEY